MTGSGKGFRSYFTVFADLITDEADSVYGLICQWNKKLYLDKIQISVIRLL